MRSASIPQHWIRLHSCLRMDAGFWLDVLDALGAKGINIDAATDDDVKDAMSEVEEVEG